MALGQSFAPLGGGMDDEERKRRMNQGGPGQAPIQTLGLRMPRVVGANAPIPQALLQGPGSAGAPGMGGTNPILAAILQAVLGNRPGMGQPGMGGAFPTPNVTPGIDTGDRPPNLPPNQGGRELPLPQPPQPPPQPPPRGPFGWGGRGPDGDVQRVMGRRNY